MVKNIIFDFGGVLYDIDFRKTFDAFGRMGFKNFDATYSQYEVDALFKKLETGSISNNDFYQQIQNMAPRPVENDEIKNAWNALLSGYRTKSLEFLTQLKNNYRLFLLSNTNAIHYDYFSPELKQGGRFSSLESFFEIAYFSHLIGLRKPDTEVFQFVLKDAGIKADETLFIDDTHTNFPNAEKLGIKTHLLLPNERIEDLNYHQY